MMFGILGFGWLTMVLMIGLPILGVILILMAAAGLFQNRSWSVAPIREQPQVEHKINSTSSNSSVGHYCANCGAGLQADWTHCPQCGAAV
jgi:zinc-ribbon domain